MNIKFSSFSFLSLVVLVLLFIAFTQLPLRKPLATAKDFVYDSRDNHKDKAPTSTPTTTATPTPGPSGGQFYVSTFGTSSGDGSFDRPWSLTTALSHPESVQPGDSIWLRGGVYGSGGPTLFTSKLVGTRDKPIIVRQYRDERATIDGGIKADGAHTWFWGVEITNSSVQRDVVDFNKDRPVGLGLYGNGNKAINLIIHNTGRAGIGFWSHVTTGYEGEIYGVLFWGNGIYDSGTTRGDSIYANIADANPLLTRTISETISFRNFNLGVKVYSDWGDRHVNGFYLSGNVAFDHPGYNIVIENRNRGLEGLKVIENYTYQTRTENRNNLKFGHTVDNQDALIKDNYFVAGQTAVGALFVNGFTKLTVTDNTMIGQNILAWRQPGATIESLSFDSNSYYGGSAKPFKDSGAVYSFNDWKTASGADATSNYSPSYPNTAKTIVRPNQYEPGRAHVIVYNWPGSATVSVDLSSVLKVGTNFEIRDAQNYFGAPLVTGVYTGEQIVLPMNLTDVAPIVGNRHLSNVHTPAEFGVFVVLTKSQ